jgi:hypothetical protein
LYGFNVKLLILFLNFKGTCTTDVYCKEVDDYNDVLFDNDDWNDDDDYNDIDGNTSNSINKFIQEIESLRNENFIIKGDRLFVYYLSGLSNDILRLTKYFQLWTNIMQPFFKSPYRTAPSASVENDFS